MLLAGTDMLDHLGYENQDICHLSVLGCFGGFNTVLYIMRTVVQAIEKVAISHLGHICWYLQLIW